MRKAKKIAATVAMSIAASMHVNAATIVVEPDDFPMGTIIGAAFPGVSLSVEGKPNSDVATVSGYWNADYATTGTQVFGQMPEPSVNVPKGWDETLGLLRADFSAPANYVQIDLIFDDDDVASLWAFGADGALLGNFTASGDGRGPVKFVSAAIARPAYDIAYVLAGGNGGEAVLLDNLQAHTATVPEPGTIGVVGLALAALGVGRCRRSVSGRRAHEACAG